MTDPMSRSATAICGLIRLALSLVAVVLLTAPAQAQTRQPSHCLAIAEAAPGLGYLQPASFRDPVPEGRVRLHYIHHASFLIRTPGGLNAVTDFTGFVGNVPLIPDVVTMNHAHSTHWTPFPDPAIPHVLRGWGAARGQGVDHWLELGEMLVRNVPTDIRSRDGIGTVEPRGNSIFVFEVAGLCIGHLGHLHHEPDAAQYAALGRLDVVLAPIDGGMTLDLPTMLRVMERLRASVVIPMHWFSEFSLNAFLRGMEDGFVIVDTGGPSVTLSRQDLPGRPTVLVLRPEWLRDEG